MLRQGRISDQFWALVEPLIPASPGRRGRPSGTSGHAGDTAPVRQGRTSQRSSDRDAAEEGACASVAAVGNAASLPEPQLAALLAYLRVERRWSSAMASFGLTTGNLVGPFWDGVRDSTLPQLISRGGAGAGLVSQ